MTKAVIAQLAALKSMPTPELKTRWKELFASEPPPYNRRFLESRLAYRVQELAFGGLSASAMERLTALAEQMGPKGRTKRNAGNHRPIAGTQLIREWKGVEHCVTVRNDGFEYLGQPYKSLSSVARKIAGTKWNGWVFFGIKNMRQASK